MTNQTGIEQGRAKFAYQCAEEGRELGKEYKSYVRKIPSMIKTNGLGATFAFVYAKKEGDSDSSKAYNKIYQQTEKWLKEKGYISPDSENLVKEIVSSDSLKYRRLTIETLAFFNWLSRFAEGMIE